MIRRALLSIFLLSAVFSSCQEEFTLSSEKEILQFQFLKTNNPSLDKDYSALVSGNSITIDLPSTTDLSSLIPSFVLSEKASAKIGSLNQISGQTRNDFTQSKVYIIVAEDQSTKNFEVRVNRLPSTQKNITEFNFLKSLNPQLEKDYPGTITGSGITVSIPHGFKVDELIATFVASDKSTVTIGTTVQKSGESKNNFGSPVIYKITAEDGSQADFTVSLVRTGIAPNSSINTSSSFHLWNSNYFQMDLSKLIPMNNYDGGLISAQAFYDFDKDGDKDLIVSEINFESNSGIDIFFFRNNGGTFQKDQSVFGGNVPQFVHARQIILGDYDNNGWMDVVFAAHGFDQAPFPGEQQKIIFNNGGKFTASNLSLPKASSNEFSFNHSVTSGDIDNDGDVDLFFTNSMRLPTGGIFMINQGNGTFTYDPSVFPSEVEYKPVFSSSLYDIDGDGYLDLIITGHDTDSYYTPETGQIPTIFWGNYTGKFSFTRKTVLPITPNYGISNSISFLDYNKDGQMDILIGKTGDGRGALQFYQGYYMQLLKNNGNRNFSDGSSAIQNNSTTSGGWVVWFLTKDIDGDGDVDIQTGDKWYNLQWKNNNGTFVKY